MNNQDPLVIDVGYHSCKAGIAGEDKPRTVFSSHAGFRRDLNEFYVEDEDEPLKCDMEVLPPFSPLDEADIDLRVYRSVLYFVWQLTEVDDRSPVLLADSFQTRRQRESMTQLLFEEFNVPSLIIANSAVLTTLASCRTTALVVDCGGGSTIVTPVVHCRSLAQAVISSPVAGEVLTDCLTHRLENNGQVLVAAAKNWTESYRNYYKRKFAIAIKEKLCRFSEAPHHDVESYELPDGRTIEVGDERFWIPEILFSPSLVQEIDGMENAENIASHAGLTEMVINCINKCEGCHHAELYSNILLTGGTASVPQLKERLQKDVQQRSSSHQVKVLTRPGKQAYYSVWVGGSLLASLGSFERMWLTKKEFEDHGYVKAEEKWEFYEDV